MRSNNVILTNVRRGQPSVVRSLAHLAQIVQ